MRIDNLKVEFSERVIVLMMMVDVIMFLVMLSMMMKIR